VGEEYLVLLLPFQKGFNKTCYLANFIFMKYESVVVFFGDGEFIKIFKIIIWKKK